jgi:hypothetical protein
MTALPGPAALAEVAALYSIESFDDILKPLWTVHICLHRENFAAFLKAVGFIIPLMDPEYASYYTKEATVILIWEFQTTDKEMKENRSLLGSSHAAGQKKWWMSGWDHGGAGIEAWGSWDSRVDCVQAEGWGGTLLKYSNGDDHGSGQDPWWEVWILARGWDYLLIEQTMEDHVMLDGFKTVVNALGEWPTSLIIPLTEPQIASIILQ